MFQFNALHLQYMKSPSYKPLAYEQPLDTNGLIAVLKMLDKGRYMLARRTLMLQAGRLDGITLVGQHARQLFSEKCLIK